MSNGPIWQEDGQWFITDEGNVYGPYLSEEAARTALYGKAEMWEREYKNK